MNIDNKTFGVLLVVIGGLVLFSENEIAWIVSAILIGIGTGIFFWKNKEDDINR